MFICRLNGKSQLLLALAYVLWVNAYAKQGSIQTVWSIGKADNSASEFALSPDGYRDFLMQDFGWEDQFYLIGHSTPATDMPYVLPGPDDKWAGSGGLAGTRTQLLTILFGLKEKGKEDGWQLIIDMVDTHVNNPPVLKVVFNGHPKTFQLEKGADDNTLNGAWDKGKEQKVILDLDSSWIRQGGNSIVLTTLQGSWLLFDQIRLDGPVGARLAPPAPVFIRNVQPAEYETTGQYEKTFQPLLVDIECLEEKANLEVILNGHSIYSSILEAGRAELEVPMPSVEKATKSSCEIKINGQVMFSGEIRRSQQQFITPADYVDTMMGSAHSRWMIAPGPWAPFSMVKLSPDNQNSGWQGGYDPHIENVAGFSHIHEWTMGGLLFMPTTGPLKIEPGDQYQPDNGYRSRIDKTQELGTIGYYRTYMSDYNIEAELTATTRASFQRYTYTTGQTGRVLLDFQIPAEYGYQLQMVDVRKVGNSRIEGKLKQFSPHVWSNTSDQEYTIHFVTEFDRPIQTLGAWTDNKIQHDVQELKTGKVKDAGVFVEFDTTANRVVQIRSGISFVSTENAGLNLEQEISTPFGWNFQAVRQHQRHTWNDILGRVVIETPDRREKMRFYTNLYRSFCRNTFSDVDGKWCDPEEKIRQLTNPNAVMLGCDAFWNTFWNLNQVWNLIAPEWSSRWVGSQLSMYDACGWLAKGPAGIEYIPVMVAEHEIPLIVGAYQMGIRDFDADKALEAMVKMQTTPAAQVGGGLAGNRDLMLYLEYKYIPYEKGRSSNTQEYAYDDWTVSQFAKALGHDQYYRQFKERSGWWKNMFDPEIKYARMKDTNGEWLTPFDPFKSGANQDYVEGNAWQLTFFVPQDIPGLVKAMGKETFSKRLNHGFTQSAKTRFNAPNEQYWDYPVVQGNQQSMHFAFLFNWGGQPWLTQKWSREILSRYYGYGTANAYLGDEDQGQMSAWFVMASIGLFQTDGGCRTEPIYEIGSPLYKKIIIDLGRLYGRGKKMTIIANDSSKTNKYIQSATLNGRKLDQWWLPASELLKGGTLILEMGPQPNKQWAETLPPKGHN